MPHSDQPKAILQRYSHLRAQSKPIISDLMDARGAAVMTCARELGLVVRNTVVLDNECEADILADYCLYYPVKRYRNIAAKWLAERGDTIDPARRPILKGMAEAHYSVFRIIRCELGYGLAVRDLIGGREHFIVDRSLSRTARPDAMLGMRILTVENITYCTGTALPTVADVIDVLRKRLIESLAQRLDEPGFTLDPHEQNLLARLVIVAAIQSGATKQVEYLEPPR